MPMMPSGTFRKKIQCQEAYVVMKPPRGGPTTGAISPGQVMKVIASIKLCFSVVRKTTSRPTGTIIAPPMPWMTRAPVNVQIPLLNPQRIEDTVKIAMAETKTVRAPTRSATHPLIGMKTASISK